MQIPKDTIDIIIGEVKSGEEQIQFNLALRNDRDSVKKLVDWLGAFDENEKNEIIDNLETALKPDLFNKPDTFKSIFFKGKSGSYSIRPIIFSIDRPHPKRTQPRFVYGQLMLDFIWKCFRPDENRDTCSTVYNLNMWGHTLLPIIDYFKNPARHNVGTIRDFYSHFGF